MLNTSDWLSFTRFIQPSDLSPLATEDANDLRPLYPLETRDPLVEFFSCYDRLMLDYLGCIDSSL